MTDNVGEIKSDDVPPDDRTPRRGGCLVGCLAFAIVGYVLSPPIVYLIAIQLEAAGWPSAAEGLMSAIATIYAPLQWLHDRYEPVSDFYDWYGGLFEPWILP